MDLDSIELYVLDATRRLDVEDVFDYPQGLGAALLFSSYDETLYCTFQTGSSSRVTADLLDELPALLVTHTEAPANLYCVTPAPFPKKEMPLSAHEQAKRLPRASFESSSGTRNA